MHKDLIAEIGLDDKGRLYVVPDTKKFPNIYREAMEVNWDDEGDFLYTPPLPRARLLPYAQWFFQITDAALQQAGNLCIGPDTRWHNIEADLKNEILSLSDLVKT